MPKLMLPIPEVTDMVTRPVVLDIVRQLVHNTRLNPNVGILYPGAEERVPLNQTTLENQDDTVKFTQEDMLLIDVTETLEEEAILTRAVLREEQPPFWKDDKLGIAFKPVYAHAYVDLSIHSRFRDKASAMRWRDEMRNKISMMRDTILHKASYSFTVPEVYWVILNEIHRLRENQAGYGEDFRTYLEKHKAPYLSEVTNVGGKVERFAVKETQQRIIGLFDFKEEPEKGSKDGEGDTWSIEFTYRFEYDKPIAVVMTYPLMVHNQLLRQKYRPKREDSPSNHLRDQPQRYAKSILHLSEFESDKEYYHWKKHEKGLAVPDFDEFFPEWIPEGTWRVVTYMLALTPRDRRDLVNIKEMPKVQFLDKVIHDWLLESEVNYLSKPGESVFNITVYEDYEHLGYQNFHIDPDFNVVANHNLDLRKTYHLRLGVYWDWDKLTDEARDRIRARPDVLDKLVCSLFPQWCGTPIETLQNHWVPIREWDRIKDMIKGYDWWSNRIFYTQQNLFVEAERRKENMKHTTEIELP